MRLTRPLTLSVDAALLDAYRRALLAPLPAVVLDAALRAALTSLGYTVPAPLLAPPSPGGDRRKPPPNVPLAPLTEEEIRFIRGEP